MKSLSDPAVAEAIIARISSLDGDAKARWGRMTAPQMICHLNDSYRVALGDKRATSKSNLGWRTVMKWGALYLPAEWPKGLKTLPEVEQGVGGTCPTEFEQDRAELIIVIHRFVRPDAEVGRHPHPLFDLMSVSEWMRWGYLHADHHLRQFGV